MYILFLYFKRASKTISISTALLLLSIYNGGLRRIEYAALFECCLIRPCSPILNFLFQLSDNFFFYLCRIQATGGVSHAFTHYFLHAWNNPNFITAMYNLNLSAFK